MAKKTVAAASAPLEEGAKKKKAPKLSVRGKIEYYWDVAELSWYYCRQNLERIAVYAPYITKEFIEQQLALITETRDLPNNVVRSAGNTKSLRKVQSKRRAILAKADLLDAALRKYNEKSPDTYQLERKESGLVSLRQASAFDYPAVSTFITNATKYLTTYGQQLVEALVLPASFLQELKDLGTAFNEEKMNLNTTRQTAKEGTGTVVSKVDDIKLQIRTMQDYGKTAFKDDPEIYRYFTEEYLLNAVRSKHPASLNGRTTWPKEEGMEKAKPVAGLLVEVLGIAGKSAVTNKKGRYEIKQLAAGEHRVRISGTGIQPVELLVVLALGTSLRQNVTVEAAPLLEVTVPKMATPPPASVNEEFTNAMKEVTASNGTSVPTNGVMVH